MRVWVWVWCLCLCVCVCVCEHQVRCVTTYALWKNTNGGCLFPIQENDSGGWEVGSGGRTEDERGERLFWLSSASPVRLRHAPHPSSSSPHIYIYIYIYTYYMYTQRETHTRYIYTQYLYIYIYQYMCILVIYIYIYLCIPLHPSSILLITIQQISIHEKIEKQSFA